MFFVWFVLLFPFQPKSDGFLYLDFPTALLVKYRIYIESAVNPKALVAHLVQHLACEQKRQNAFNGKGEGRNQTELLGKRGKNLCTNVLLKWGKGWSEVPTESQSWGRGTPNDS